MGGFLRSIVNKKVIITLDLTTLNTAARTLVMSLAKKGIRMDVPTARAAIIEVLKSVGKKE